MMSTRSSLPKLAILVIVLLLDTPRSAAQEDTYPVGKFTPPPPPRSSRRRPPRHSTQETAGSDPGPDPSPDPTAQQEPLGWDASRYPATDFRSEVTPRMFALWPESLSYVKFEYYCEDKSPHEHKLEDFVYKKGEGHLVTRPYFDVGLVDKQFKPYFQHWRFWQVDIKRISRPLRCEFSDLQRLYAYRLKRNVLATGLGYGVAALTILQVAVIAFTALLRMCTHSTQQPIRIPSASAPTFWSKIFHSLHIWKSETPWIDCICDWIHLLLLVVIGFAMMEGVGHGNFKLWRSRLLCNIAVTYTYLTLFSMISSFLHQCAHFLTRRSFTDPALPMNTTPTAAGSASGLSEDWRYQRIFGQFGVLVLMGMYLIGMGHGLNSVTGIVVAAIVVACIWSAGVSVVVAARSVRDMGRCLLPSAWKLRAFSDSRTHARPATPQPASNVFTVKPEPEYYFT